MWDNDPDVTAYSPFEEAIPDPGTDPGAAPLVCVRFNEAWRPIVAGALLAALPPGAWSVSDPAALLDVEIRAEQLLHAIGRAERCAMAAVAVTIPAGSGSGSIAVVFSQAFAAAPILVVSADSPDVIASYTALTAEGFTAVLTAFVATSADLTATLSYMAGAAL